MFRYQLEHCYADESPAAFFFSYQRRDIPDEFLANFNSDKLIIKKRSQRREFFLKTGTIGIVVNVNNIHLTTPSFAEVDCSCGRRMLEGYSYSLRLKRTNNVWKVVRSKIVGVS